MVESKTKSQPFLHFRLLLLTFGRLGPCPQQERHESRRHLLQLRVRGARQEQWLDDYKAKLLGEPAQ
jgi:hypothetical protein